MEKTYRKTGIDIIGDAPWGTHYCQFYKTKKDLIDILVPYFKAGLENNEFCMWVTSEPLGIEDARRSLKRAVENLHDCFKKGQIEILDYSQVYTKSGKFEADKVLEGWAKKEKEALKKGFDGLRITGNTFWLEKKDWRDFAEYEEKVTSTIGKLKMLVLCSYSLDKCGLLEIIDVVNTHNSVLFLRKGKWTVVENVGHRRLMRAEMSRKQVEGFTAYIQAKRELEKKLLAQNIHDDVAQVLAAIKMNLSMMYGKLPEEQKFLSEKINSINKLLIETIHKVKRMYTELRPSLLNHIGLVAAIEWQVEEFQERLGVKCDVNIECEEIELDWDRKTAFFRVFQMLLANVGMHAKATRLRVKLSLEGRNLKLELKDNGIGIKREQLTSPNSFGIIEIRERIHFLEGEVEIKGIPDKGTKVTVKIPLH